MKSIEAERGKPVAAGPGPSVPPKHARFGRDRRVRKRSEFLRIQADSRRVTTAHYVFLLAAQRPIEGGSNGFHPAGRAPSRIGLVVTRKIGGAVARNRIKRVCRECFRLWPGLVPDGVDLLVIARKGADELGLEKARAEWAAVSGLLRRRAQEALAHGNQATHLPGGAGRPRTE